MLQQFRNSASVTGLMFVLLFVLSVCSLWAQRPHTDRTEQAAIQHARVLDASSLDRNLPKVTLEFLLQYESGGASIKWSMISCGQLRKRSGSHGDREATCVEAEFDLKDNRSARVVVSLGRINADPAAVPSVFSVTVIDQDGLVRYVNRLSDLPRELRRPSPKGPRDLSPPEVAA